MDTRQDGNIAILNEKVDAIDSPNKQKKMINEKL